MAICKLNIPFLHQKKKTSATPHHVPLRAMLDRIMRLKGSFPPLVVQFQRIISKDLDKTEQRECFARTSKIQDFESLLLVSYLSTYRHPKKRTKKIRYASCSIYYLRTTFNSKQGGWSRASRR